MQIREFLPVDIDTNVGYIYSKTKGAISINELNRLYRENTGEEELRSLKYPNYSSADIAYAFTVYTYAESKNITFKALKDGDTVTAFYCIQGGLLIYCFALTFETIFIPYKQVKHYFNPIKSNSVSYYEAYILLVSFKNSKNHQILSGIIVNKGTDKEYLHLNPLVSLNQSNMIFETAYLNHMLEVIKSGEDSDQRFTLEDDLIRDVVTGDEYTVERVNEVKEIYDDLITSKSDYTPIFTQYLGDIPYMYISKDLRHVIFNHVFTHYILSSEQYMMFLKSIYDIGYISDLDCILLNEIIKGSNVV